MRHHQHIAAACDSLLDALALELLAASDDEFGPLHGGRSLGAAADQVRQRMTRALRRPRLHPAPVCPEHHPGAPSARTE